MLPKALLATALVSSFVAALAACGQKREPTQTQATTTEESATPTTVAIERPATPTRDGATLALGTLSGKKVAFVADDDTAAVRIIDLGARKEMASVVLGSRPGQLLVTKDGRLAVALRDDASVALLDAQPDGKLVLAKKIATATEPVAIALSPDDATLYVATGLSHSLEAFRLADAERVLDVTVAREPRAVSLAEDGKRAFVAHASASDLEVVDVANATIARKDDLGIPGAPNVPMEREMIPMAIDRRRPVVDFDALVPTSAVAFDDCFDCGSGTITSLELPARFARQAYALAHVVISTAKGPEEVFVIPHTEMMTGNPMIISTGYGGGGVETEIDEPAERFSLSVIDVATGKRKLLGQPGDARDKTGCHLPRGAATDGTGTVYVACYGSDSLMAFAVGEKSYDVPVDPPPQAKLHFKIDRDGNVKAQPGAVRKVQYLAMGSAGRVAVPPGPNGVVLDAEDKQLVSFSQLDGSLSLVPLGAFDGKGEAVTIKLLRSSGLTEQVASGRKLFFSGGDARISHDGRACSSCHPDGRDDGLVWSTPDGPRQTIMLAGRVNREGPFGWLGKHSTLQVHMQTTMKNLKGTGLDPAQQDELAAFLVSLRTPARKWRALTDEEVHGRDVFNSGDAQCSSCHAEKTGFTDHDTHDVRSATPADQSKQFLVPSLTNVGASAPYFHDGRYASLEELIDKCDGSMGSTKQLGPGDKKALAAYLRTL